MDCEAGRQGSEDAAPAHNLDEGGSQRGRLGRSGRWAAPETWGAEVAPELTPPASPGSAAPSPGLTQVWAAWGHDVIFVSDLEDTC